MRRGNALTAACYSRMDCEQSELNQCVQLKKRRQRWTRLFPFGLRTVRAESMRAVEKRHECAGSGYSRLNCEQTWLNQCARLKSAEHSYSHLNCEQSGLELEGCG